MDTSRMIITFAAGMTLAFLPFILVGMHYLLKGGPASKNPSKARSASRYKAVGWILYLGFPLIWMPNDWRIIYLALCLIELVILKLRKKPLFQYEDSDQDLTRRQKIISISIMAAGPSLACILWIIWHFASKAH